MNSLFIRLSLHALALHLAVKILTDLLYEFEHVNIHTSVGCISSECQQDRTLLY